MVGSGKRILCKFVRQAIIALVTESGRMMKKEILGSVLAALFAGALLGYWGASGLQASQISQLQSEVATLQTERTSLLSQLATLTSDKQTLQNEISQLNARIAALNATIATLRRGEPSILSVNFSPRGGCASKVIYWLGKANSSVHVLIYSFTLDSIGDAVLSAYNRGVEVKVVFEKQQVSQYSEYFRLSAAGVPVRNDTNPDFMHTKVAIIDGSIVLVGSFNWSASADDDNNEVLLVIKSAALATTLEAEFQRIWTTGR